MYDAYDPHMMLLTGYTGAESANHDWIQVFGDLELLNHARGIGLASRHAPVPRHRWSARIAWAGFVLLGKAARPALGQRARRTGHLMRMRRRLGWLPCISIFIAGAAFAQGPTGWWLGFVDTRGHAFLELPADARLCDARTAAITRLPAPAPGTLVPGAIKAASYLPPGAHLTFGVTDLGGRYGERVLPRVAAIVRDDESRKGPCWLLAEAGTEAAGYVAEEDRLAFGTYPPRPLTVRQAPEDWQSYGGASGAGAPDARFNPIQGLPPAWRERVARLLPGYTQVYGQSFSAVLAPGGHPQALSLIGAINDGSRDAGPGAGLQYAQSAPARGRGKAAVPGGTQRRSGAKPRRQFCRAGGCRRRPGRRWHR